ncbi:MAG: DUF1330 domain-containing protein [Proteobacteria bacterium]|nr:DUF1330 domain-containing protein [Pseudomonadota bacterium]
MVFINPTRDQFKQLMSLPDEGPVLMVNLLKFKPDGGAESYEIYAEATKAHFEGVGGRVMYRGRYRMPVIGDEDWDEVLLAWYPSIAAFMDMQRNAGYQAAVPYRTDALVDSRLWAVSPA